jgi:hypothetical protein
VLLACLGAGRRSLRRECALFFPVRYRADLEELISSLQLILGGECQREIVEVLEQALGSEDEHAWRAVEAALIALRGSAQTVRNDENLYTPRLFVCLEHLPNHPHVITSALQTVPQYAEWLNVHPEHLESVKLFPTPHAHPSAEHISTCQLFG